jgi:hypothetical protein
MPRGFDGVRSASADVEARRGSGGPGALYFRLKAGDEAIVRFLEQDDDIFWCMMHEVPVEGRQWGKNVPCLDQEKDGTPCPGCERDMDRRFKGYINLIWFNAPVFKRDSENKIVKDRLGDPVVTGEKPQVAVWNSGIRLFEELDEINSNYKGLMSRPFKIKRKGSGLDTKYVITPADPDGGAKPMGDDEQKLANEKNDLNQFTKPGSYEDFMKELGQGGGGQGNGQGGGGGEQQQRSNPFMRNR